MTAFPALIPSSRVFTPGEYPHTAFRAWNGLEGRVRHSNVMLASTLRLTFISLTEANMLSILSHYTSRQGEYLPFTIPSQLLSGVSAAADYTLTGYQWRYAEPPIVDDIPCAGYSVEVVLESVPFEAISLSGLDAQVVITSFTPGAAAAANGIQKQVDSAFAPGQSAVAYEYSITASIATANGFSVQVASMVAAGAATGGASIPESSTTISSSLAPGTAIGGGAAAPTFQAAGGTQGGNSALTGTFAVAWPTHAVNDIGILVIETSGEGSTVSITTPSGWQSVPGSPVTDVADATGSKLQVWWKRAASTSETSVTVPDSGDHQFAKIFTFRGCATSGDPWDVTTTGSKTTASSTATVPAVTTTVDNTLIVMIIGRPDDSSSTAHFGVPSNANLTDIAERGEVGSVGGNGGGYVVATGVKASAGNTGTSTLTKTVSTTDTYMVIALKG
jgi:hypothetical protein